MDTTLISGWSLLIEERGSSSSSNAINNSLSSLFFLLAGTSVSPYRIGCGLQPTDRREFLAMAQVFLNAKSPQSARWPWGDVRVREG